MTSLKKEKTKQKLRQALSPSTSLPLDKQGLLLLRIETWSKLNCHPPGTCKMNKSNVILSERKRNRIKLFRLYKIT